MAARSSKTGWIIVAVAAIAIALGLWLAMDEELDAAPRSSANALHSADPSALADTRAVRSSNPQTASDIPPAARTTAERREQTDEALRGSDEPTRAPTEDGPVEEQPRDPAAAFEGPGIPSEAHPVQAVEPSASTSPIQQIAEGGRLSIDPATLQDFDVLALGLAMPDEARGGEALAVKIVSVDGRRMETTAAHAPGSGSGLRLEIDPEWLTPGRYLIEVKTAEKTHLPLRRYVLEVP